MNEVRVYLLGAPEVKHDSEAVHFGRRKTLALLAYLVVGRQPQRRETLAALLWPELDRPRALASLRRCLVSLSKILGDHLDADRATIGIRSDTGLWSDVGQLSDTVSRDLPPERRADADGDEALRRMEGAARLYRGDFLTGFSLPDGEEFDDWQFTQTERFRREQARLLDALTESRRARGDLGGAIQFARQRLALDRLAEDVHRLLIRLHLEAGERSEAIRQYERCAAILKEELGVEPEPATRALLDQLRGGEAGRRGESGEPSASEARGRLRAVPATRTPILGREGELAEISARLTNSVCRLLTLIGPGGVGKTRLALEAARLLDDAFEDGVCFVPLAAATPQSMLRAVTDGLGLALDPKGESDTQLMSFLGSRRCLLVLDNFENLTSEAALVGRILSATPNVRILVTSRERLNLRGEWLFEVKGLEAPPQGAESLEHLERYSAVQLFVQAARRIDPGFELSTEVRPWVARICRLLVGMPLGIELAAAWLRLVSCREIAVEIQQNIDFLSSNLRDLPERHRSLRAIFESSLRLLSSRERELLTALSEFQGGFSREAAERVAGATLPLLAALQDKSLLTASEGGRYQLHELIRQFAAEQLRNREELHRSVQARHCEYYLELVARSAVDLRSERLKSALSTLSSEADNLRAAWTNALRERRMDLVDSSCDAYHQFHRFSNRFGEGEEVMAAAAEAISRQQHPLSWAKVATRQGLFNNRLGRYRKAQALLEDSLRILQDLNVPREIAFAQTALSDAFFHLGGFDRAESLAAEAVAGWRSLEDDYGLANALVQLGRTLGYTGEIERAKTILEEAYELFEGFGDIQGMARCLNNLANLTYLAGRLEEALRLYEMAMKKFEQLGDRRGQAFSLTNLGLMMDLMGDHKASKRLSREAIAIFGEIGYRESESHTHGPALTLENCGRACLGLGEYEEARDCFMSALAGATRIQETPLVLTSLIGLGRWLIHDGRPGKAWEIVDLCTDHPNLSQEGSNQLEDLRRRLEQIPGVQRPPRSEQLPSIRLRLLVDEMLSEMKASSDVISSP